MPQSYNVHHDYNEVQISRQPGVRILTFFLYLNDVEMGGETNFDHLNLTVTPKRGRALLWPSVLDHDPDARDPRTTHQACPVMRGTKYAANLWFHRREWEGPLRSFCI
jgi:prolyl 4-hydroxylase